MMWDDDKKITKKRNLTYLLVSRSPPKSPLLKRVAIDSPNSLELLKMPFVRPSGSPKEKVSVSISKNKK